jgi:hypothetical protein
MYAIANNNSDAKGKISELCKVLITQQTATTVLHQQVTQISQYSATQQLDP